MAMPFASYSAFSQWSPCNVSPHSALVELCRRQCSSPVDAQHLSWLWCFLCWFCSSRGCFIEWPMSTEVPCYWPPGLDWIRATFTLCTAWFQYLSIITGFLVETNFIPPKRVYPGLSNCYCIISSPYDIAMLVKSLTQQGEFAFPFANAPTGSYRWNISALAFLCIRSHEGQITYMRLRYTCICRKAIC